MANKQLLTRLQRLASQAIRAGGAAPTLDSILAAFEERNGIPPGSISRTPEAAAAKGYASIAGELAEACGLSYGELVEALRPGRTR